MKAVSTIRARLLLMSAALLLPVAALLSYQGYRDFSDERKAAATAAVRLAEITAAEISRFLGDTQTALASLSRRPLVRALDPRQCDPALSDYIDSHPYFANILTVDLSLRVVCSAVEIPPNAARVPRDIWMDRLVQSGQFTPGKPYRGPITGKWVVALAYPLHDQQGGIAGAVNLPIDLVHLRLVANRAALMPGTDIWIVTGDGTVIASLENPDEEVGKDARGRGIVDIVLARGRGEAQVAGDDGVERVYGFLPIPGTDWSVYAGISAGVALRNANERALQSAAIGSLVVLLALALAVFAARAVARPIESAEEAARQIAGGDRDARFRPEGASELAELLVQFNRTLDALAEDKRRLRLLSHRLFEVKEDERRRLARELHDRVGPDLTALSLNLKMLRGEMPADGMRQANARLDDCEAILDQTTLLVRDVLVDLRPPGLDELGLAAALAEYARQVAGRGGFSAAVSGAAIPRLPPATEITLFRIAQEALTNIARHAYATEVTLALESGPDAVVLTVADNGRGFDTAAPLKESSASLGLVNMRERAESVGGRLRVESAPGQGTRVIVEAPRAGRGAA